MRDLKLIAQQKRALRSTETKLHKGMCKKNSIRKDSSLQKQANYTKSLHERCVGVDSYVFQAGCASRLVLGSIDVEQQVKIRGNRLIVQGLTPTQKHDLRDSRVRLYFITVLCLHLLYETFNVSLTPTHFIPGVHVVLSSPILYIRLFSSIMHAVLDHF